MASVTATAKPETAPGRASAAPARSLTPGRGSRLGRLIIVLNLLGLAILVGGALVLNELRQGLVQARERSLQHRRPADRQRDRRRRHQGDPDPLLEADAASDVAASRCSIPQLAAGAAVRRRRPADRRFLRGRPTGWRPAACRRRCKPGASRSPCPASAPTPSQRRAPPSTPRLTDEVSQALARRHRARPARRPRTARRVVSVSIPIEHVRAVLGVLTLEAGDVDQIIAAQRVALMPVHPHRRRGDPGLLARCSPS